MDIFALTHWESHDLGAPARYGMKAKKGELVLMVAVGTVPKPSRTNGGYERTVQNDIEVWEQILGNLERIHLVVTDSLAACRAEMAEAEGKS